MEKIAISMGDVMDNQYVVVFDLISPDVVRVWEDFGSGVVPSADYPVEVKSKNGPNTYAITYHTKMFSGILESETESEKTIVMTVTGFDVNVFCPERGLLESVEFEEGFIESLWQSWSACILMRSW